ncbi:MAG: DinB family protein [SAR202 cluster bacterium]|nr:DinB family protein [SAR202 cluster bacterium]|tara:strand:+ start:199 stop:651 length:453 start_codon:yes stop_codon:yes gene_type:complete
MNDIENLMNRLRSSRLKINDLIKNIPDEHIHLPIPNNEEGRNAGRFKTVQEVLYRFIAHEVEHTIHLTKILSALNKDMSEAKMILKELQESRAKLEGIIVTLEDGDLDRKPHSNEWSPRKIIDHLLHTEETFLSDMIIQAIEQKKLMERE